MVGMMVVGNDTLTEMFPVDFENGVTYSKLRGNINKVNREVVAIDNIAAAYTYQGKKGTDVGSYASMIKGDWDRVFPQSIDYGSILSAKGTELPEDQIGSYEQRIATITAKVVPDYFTESGKLPEQVATEIEKNRMGVMTDQSMRLWDMVARGSIVEYGEIFTKPMFSEMLEEITERIAVTIAPKFGYKADAMSDRYSPAYQDCLVAARRGLMIFRQWDLDMQYCAAGKSDKMDEVDVELVHNDAGKMAYFELRAFGQSWDKDYPNDIGIARSVQHTLHNLVQAAPIAISIDRKYLLDPSDKKPKKESLSLWQLFRGTNGQKGLRLDQLPWGKRSSENVVKEYFNAVRGVRDNVVSVGGFPNDIFNVPYCLGLSYAFKYYSLMTEDPISAIKKASLPAELGGLNKAMDTVTRIFWSTTLEEEAIDQGILLDKKGNGAGVQQLLTRIILLDKCNFLIACNIASTTSNLSGQNSESIEQFPLVDAKSAGDILTKWAAPATMIGYSRQSGFLTMKRDKERVAATGQFKPEYVSKINKIQEIEAKIIQKGCSKRSGMTIEDAIDFGLFTKEECQFLRKSQMYSSVAK